MEKLKAQGRRVHVRMFKRRRHSGEGAGGGDSDEDGTGGTLHMLPGKWPRTMSLAMVYERHTHWEWYIRGTESAGFWRPSPRLKKGVSTSSPVLPLCFNQRQVLCTVPKQPCTLLNLWQV